MSARRWLVATAATILVLVVLAAVVVVLRPPPAAFAPDSPEGTVMRYVGAVLVGDVALARATFGADLAAACPPSRFATRARESLWWDATTGRDDWHVALLDVATLSDGRVRVRVRVGRTVVAPPFDVDASASEHVFVLAFEDGAWRITDFDWPIPCS